MVAVISGEALGLFNSTQTGVGSANFGQGREQVYVNASTGNLVLRQRDEFAAASGLDLSLLRTYNSQGQLDGDNNDGFRFNFTQQLVNLVGSPNQPGSQITRIGGDGAETVYTYDATLQAYVSPDGAGAHDQIVYDSGNSQWVWREGSSRVEEVYGDVNGDWKLIARVDAEGRQVTFGHNASGLVDSITDAAGQVFTIAYTGTQVTGVTVASDGVTQQRLHYSYDTQGRLQTITVDLSPEDSSIADGNVYTTTYAYDGSSTRITSIAQSDGTLMQFAYTDVDGQGDYRVAEVRTGRASASGQATELDGSDLRITTYAYDLANDTTTITQVSNPEADPASWVGPQTELVFDSAGRITRMTAPADQNGLREITQYGYDADGNLLTLTDHSGDTATYEYDSRGNQTLMRDAQGNTVAREYDSHNQLIKETVYLRPDPDGDGAEQPAEPRVTHYIYDDSQRLRYIIGHDGTVQETRYSDNSQNLQNGIPARTVSSISYLQHGYYDQFGTDNYTEASAANSVDFDLATLNAWVQNIQADIQTNNIQNATRRSDTQLDFRGQVHSVTRYNNVDQTGTGIADGSESTSYTVYDANGKLLSTIDPRGTGAGSTSYNTSYAYDGLGRLLGTTDAKGHTSTTLYNDAQSQIVSTDADGLQITRSYASNGSLISEARFDTTNSNATLGETKYFYDSLGRIRATKDASGAISHSLYDDRGQMVAVISATGSLTEFHYDAEGKQTQTTHYANKLNSAQLGSLLIKDAGQNPIGIDESITLDTLRPAETPDQDRKNYQYYDSADRVRFFIDAEGYLSETQYNAQGQTLRTTQYDVKIQNPQAETTDTLAAKYSAANASLSVTSDSATNWVNPIQSYAEADTLGFNQQIAASQSGSIDLSQSATTRPAQNAYALASTTNERVETLQTQSTTGSAITNSFTRPPNQPYTYGSTATIAEQYTKTDSRELTVTSAINSRSAQLEGSLTFSSTALQNIGNAQTESKAVTIYREHTNVDSTNTTTKLKPGSYTSKTAVSDTNDSRFNYWTISLTVTRNDGALPSGYDGTVSYNVTSRTWDGSADLTKLYGDNLPAGNYTVKVEAEEYRTRYVYVSQSGTWMGGYLYSHATYTQTKTYNVGTRIKWYDPTDGQNKTTEFYYKSGSGSWVGRSFSASGHWNTVSFDNPASGTYSFRIDYLYGSEVMLRGENTYTTIATSNQSKSTPFKAQVKRVYGSSAVNDYSTATNIESIKAVSTKVGDPEKSYEAMTYPQDIVGDGESWNGKINLRIGSPLPIGKYDVELFITYTNGDTSSDSFVYESGTQYFYDPTVVSWPLSTQPEGTAVVFKYRTLGSTGSWTEVSPVESGSNHEANLGVLGDDSKVFNYEYVVEYKNGNEVVKSTAGTFSVNKNGTATDSSSINAGFDYVSTRYKEVTGSSEVLGYFNESQAATIARADVTVRDKVTGAVVSTNSSYPADYLKWLQTENPTGYTYDGHLNLSSDFVQHSYNDPQNFDINNWEIYDTDPAGATMQEVFDASLQRNVVEVSGSGTTNGFRIWKNPLHETWQITDGTVARAEVNFSGSTIFYYKVDTSKGSAYVSYNSNLTQPKITGSSSGVIYYNFPLDTQYLDGNWHAFERDIQADIYSLDPSSQLLTINNFLVRGSGRIGAIEIDTHTPTGNGELGNGRYTVEVDLTYKSGSTSSTSFDYEIGTQTEYNPTEFRWPVSTSPTGSIAIFEYESSPGTWTSVPVAEDGTDLKVILGDIDDETIIEGAYNFRIRYEQDGEVVKETVGSPTLDVTKGAIEPSNFDFQYTVVSLQNNSGHAISGYPVSIGSNPALQKIVAVVKDSGGAVVSTAETWPQLFGSYNGEVNLSIGSQLASGKAYTVELTLHYEDGSTSVKPSFAVEVGSQPTFNQVIDWSEAAYAPQADEITRFEYRRAGSNDAWSSVAVSQNGSDFSVNLGYALSGNYEYRASSYRDADGNGYTANDRLLRTLSGAFSANSSGSVSANWDIPTYQRASLEGYAIEGYLTATEAADIAWLEAVVTDNATGLPISAQPALTWIDPATLRDGSFAGRVNLLVGDQLPDGDYTVEITRHYVDGSSVVDTAFQHQVGLQQQAVVNPQLTLALDEPYGATALSLSIRPVSGGAWETLPIDLANWSAELDKASHPNGVYEYQLSYTLDVGGTPITKSGVGRFTLAAGESTIQALSATASGVDLSDARIERSFYNDAGRVAATLDAEGYLTEYHYNRAGQLVSTTQYANRVADYANNAHWLNSGTLQTLRPAADPAFDRGSYWIYDGQGREAAVIDAEGYVTEHQYDAAGNRVRSTRYADSLHDLNELNTALAAVGNDASRLSLGSDRALGQVRPLASSDDRVTEWRYDARNQVTHATDATGNTSSFTYTAGGQLETSHSGIAITAGSILDNYLDNYQGNPTFTANTGAARDHTTEYDVQGRVIAEKDHLGRVVISHSYDDSGRRIASTDANGYTTHYAYTADGNLKYSVSPVFVPGTSTIEWQVTEFSYNAFGEMVQTRTYANRLSDTLLGGLGLNGDAAVLDTSVAGLADAADTITSTAYTQRGQVDNATDGEGFVTEYQYNAFGERTQLSQAIDRANTQQAVTDFSYSRRGQLENTTSHLSVGPFATISSSSVYNAFGEVASSTDGRGFTTEYAYDRLGQLATQTNALDQSTRFTYDAFGRVLTRTDALNRTTSYQYDDATRTQTVTTPEGVQTKTINNLHGETFEVYVKVNGSWQRRAQYQYDTQGNLTDTTDALNNTRSREHNAAGQLTATVDERGVRSGISYDPQGRVLTRTQDVGGLSLTTTNRYGHRFEETVDASGSVTRTEYDNNGRVDRVIVDATQDGSGLNLLTQYDYDGQGNLLEVKEGSLTGGINGTASFTRTTQYSYDELGQVQSETVDPNGLALTTSYQYDQNGNRTAVTNALGLTTYTAYDELGRALYTLSPSGDPAAPQYVVVENQYNAAGELSKTVQHGELLASASLPADIATGVDPAVIVTLLGDSSVDRSTTYLYNDDGQLTHSIDNLGQVTETVYDSAGRVSAVIRYADRINPSTETVADLVRDTSLDRETRYQYDAAGRQTHTQRVFEQGGVQYAYVTETLYTDRGEVAGEIAYAQAIELATQTTAILNPEAADNRHSTFVYDAAGRRTHSIDSLGFVTETRYDDINNTETVIRYANGVGVPAASSWGGLTAADLSIVASNQKDQVIVTQYDSAGRKDSLTEKVWNKASAQLDSFTEGYGYDALGNRIEIIDQRHFKTTFSYDAAGRLTHKLVPQDGSNGYLSTWEYDALGQVKTETRYSQAVAQTANPSSIDTVLLAHAQDRSTGYTYTARGEVATTTDSAGVVTEKRYTAFGETWLTIEAKGLPEQRVTYRAFDQLGRLVEETAGLPDDQQITIDNRSSLTAAELGTDEQVATTYFTYNSFGELGTLVSPRGPGYVSQQHHDQLGRKVGETDAQGGVTQTALDAFGNIVATTDPNGNTGGFFYDANNQLTHQVNPDGAVTTYVYDAFGQATDVRTYAQKLPAGTDIANLTRAGLGSLLSGTQDPISDRHTSNEYDNRGQLLKTIRHGYDLINGTATQSITEYQYDKAGNRVATIDALGGRTDYVLDAQGRITKETGPQFNAALSAHSTATTNVRAITEYSYNAFDRISASEGKYWDVSAALEKTAPGGVRTTQMAYDHNGQLIALIGPAFTAASNASINNPDFDGSIGTVTLKQASEKRYDALGRLIYEGQRGLQGAALNADGTVSGTQHGQIQASAYSYNRLDQQIFALDADGGLTYQQHDAAGNVTTEARYDQRLKINGATWSGAIAQLNLNNPAEHWRTDAQALQANEFTTGRSTHYQYNANNLLIKSESDSGVFFDLNNLIDPQSTSGDQQELQNGFSLGSTQSSQVIYDANGNSIIQIDGKDQPSFAVYDAAGNRVLAVDRLGYVTEYEYDGLGQVIGETRYAGALDFANLGAPADNQARHTWIQNLYNTDRAALVANTVTGEERTTEYVYNGQGLLVEERTKGESFTRVSNSGTALNVNQVTSDLVTRYGYNGAGQLKNTVRYDGDENAADSRTETITYNKLGQQTQTQGAEYTDYQGNTVRGTVSYRYDLYGNRTAEIVHNDSGNQVTSHSYNALGKRTETRDARENRGDANYEGKTQFTFDAFGKAVYQTQYQTDIDNNQSQVVTWLQYDALGRETARTNNVDQTEFGGNVQHDIAYNTHGQIIGKGINTDARDSVIGGKYQEYYVYDDLGRLFKTNSGNGTPRLYLYDQNGNAALEISAINNNSLDGIDTAQQAVNEITQSETQWKYSLYDKNDQLITVVEPPLDTPSDNPDLNLSWEVNSEDDKVRNDINYERGTDPHISLSDVVDDEDSPATTIDSVSTVWVDLNKGSMPSTPNAAVTNALSMPSQRSQTTVRDNNINYVDDQGEGYDINPDSAIAVDGSLSWVDNTDELFYLSAGDPRLNFEDLGLTSPQPTELAGLLGSTSYQLDGTSQGNHKGYIERDTQHYYTSRQVTLDSGRSITVFTNRIEVEEQVHIFVPLTHGATENGWREVVITTKSYNYDVTSDFLQADDTQADNALENAQSNPLAVMPSLDWEVNNNTLTLNSSDVASVFGNTAKVKVLAKNASGQVVMNNTQYNWSDGMSIALNSNAASVSLTFVDPDGLVLHAVDLYTSAATSQSGSIGLPGEGVGLEHLPEVNKFWLSAGYRSSKQGSATSTSFEYHDSVRVKETTYQSIGTKSVSYPGQVEAYGDVTVTYTTVRAKLVGAEPMPDGTKLYEFRGEVQYTVSGLRDATGAKINISVESSSGSVTVTGNGSFTATAGWYTYRSSSTAPNPSVTVSMTTNGQTWGTYTGSGGVTRTSPERIKVHALPPGTESIRFKADGVTKNVDVPTGQNWVYVDSSAMNNSATNLAFELWAYSGNTQSGTVLNHATGNFNNASGGTVSNITNAVTKTVKTNTYSRNASSNGNSYSSVFYSQVGLYNREAIRNIALQLSGAANDETLIAHHATYNAFGETVASIDNNGNATLYEYDQRGNVVKELKPEADVYTEQMTSFRAHTATEYGVNAFGEVVMEKAGAEAAAGATTATKDAVNAYNLQHEQIRLQDYQAGLLVASQDGEGYYDTQAYDQAGNLKGSSQLAYRADERGVGTSALYYQVAYHYDANNQLVRMNRFQDGSQAIDYAFSGIVPSYDEWDYDELGNRIRHRNALYGGTNYVLNATFDSTGWASASGTIGQETYRYDGMGRVLQYKSYSGQITDYAYAWTDAMTRNVLAADGQQAQGPADQVQLGGYITSIAKGGMGGIVDTDWNQSSQEDVLSDAVDYFGKAVWHDDLGGHRIEYAYNYAGWLSRQTGNTALSGNATWETRNNQDIRYTYYHNGNLFRTYDYGNNGLADGDQTAENSGIAPAVTEYRYDKAGNRTGELYYRSNDLYNNLGRVVYQHSTAQYDEQGRIHSIEGYDEYGNAYQIDYTFDAFGNRRSVSSVYDGRYVDNLDGTIQGKTQSFYYTYDKNNRFTLTLGEFENGQIVLGKTGTAITYNGLDQRYLATRASDGSIREKYAYDTNGRLLAVRIDQGNGFVLRSSRFNNDAGQATDYFEYDSAGELYSITRNYHNADGTLLGYKTTRYDENGASTGEITRSRNTFLGDGQTVNTTVTSAYPEDGSAATVTTLYNSYEKWDSYKTKSVVISADNKDLTPEQRANWENGEAYYTYDSNGHIRRVYDVEGERAIAYVTDKEGRTLVREEINDSGQNALGREMRHFYYFNGHAVGDVGNDKVPSRFDYVKALADAEGAGNRHLNDNGDHVQAVQSADFDQNFQPINPNYPASSYSSYEAQGGETLQSIAAMVWGDASLWYLLADANGLKGDEVLTKGQRIELPNVVTNIHNNADTFRPVDGALQMGNTSPTLPDVPPPPPVDEEGCGLKQIIVLVVAVVAAFYLGPAVFNALAGPLGAALGGGAAATFAGGAIAAGAAGATVSAATQVASIAVGLQDKFDWSEVAKSGVTSMVTFGVMEGLQAVSGSDSWLNSTAKFLSTNKIGAAVTQNVVNQGVNMQFGDQEKFNWAAVAAAGAGGAFQGAMDGDFDYNGVDYQTRTFSEPNLNDASAFLSQVTDVNNLTRAFFSAAINEALDAAVWDRKFDFAAVAQNTASSQFSFGLTAPVQRALPETDIELEELYPAANEMTPKAAVDVAEIEQQTITEQVSEERKKPAAEHPAAVDSEVESELPAFDGGYADLTSYLALMDEVNYADSLTSLFVDSEGSYLSSFDTGEALAGLQLDISAPEPSVLDLDYWQNAWNALAEDPRGQFTNTVASWANEINYAANVLFGGAELVAAGTYNGGVQIAGGVASIPGALFGSVDMAVSVQESIYDTYSWELKSDGAQEIVNALSPAAQTVGGWLDTGRDWSEEHFGLGATAIAFGTVQAGLEVGGLLTGTKGLKGAWGMIPGRSVPNNNSLRFNSQADPLLDSMGPAHLSHPSEYKAILKDLEANNVAIKYGDDSIAFSPNSSGGPLGHEVLLPNEFSISALRHEYGHFLDHKALGFPRHIEYFKKPELTVATERRQYLGEIRTAREIGDVSARRTLIENYLNERNYVIDRYYQRTYGGKVNTSTIGGN